MPRRYSLKLVPDTDQFLLELVSTKLLMGNYFTRVKGMGVEMLSSEVL